MKYLCNISVICIFSILSLSLCRGETLAPEKQKKIDKLVAQVQSWASDPVIVNAVKAQNAHLPEGFSSMTQEKWTELTIMDSFVKGLMKSEVGLFLKSKKTEEFTLILINDAQGYKVGYVTKSLNWNHKGLPQHEQPLQGKVFQGEPKVHPATGVNQILMGVPVLDNGKPIGSIVFGVSVAALE